MRNLTMLLLVSALVASLCACGGSSEPAAPSGSSAPAETETVASEPDYYFRDGVMVNQDVRIEITDWQVIPAGQGDNLYGEKPLIVFYYDVTNLSGAGNITPLTAWTHVFTAVQDTDPDQVNRLDPGIPMMDYLDTQLEPIKPDRTVSHAVSYQLDSTTVPVVLQALSGYTINGLGEQTFEIAQ